MFVAGRALLRWCEHPVVPGAMPPAFDRRRVQAGPTGHGGPTALMARGMVITEPAFKPRGVLADPRRRVLGEDDTATLVQQPLGHRAVSLDPLDMQRVGILADRHVERAGDARQVHVYLHLRGMLGLRQHHALRGQIGKALCAVRLELQHMPGFRGLEQAERHAIQRAAEMPTMGLDADLASRFRIQLQNRRPGGTQVADHPVLFQLAGLKQAQQAARKACRCDPAEIIPESACAGFADDGRAEVIAEAITLPGFIRRINGRECRRGRCGKISHHKPSRSLRAWASDRI